MPIRNKTVEYSFNFITSSIAAGASGSHAPLVIHIPETGSHRTFRSVVVQQFFFQSPGTAISPSAMGGSIQFTGPSRSPISTGITSSTLTNSGEDHSFMCQRDVTGFFQAYFSSSFNHVTCSLTSQLTQTGQPYTNIASKIIITYSYEELSSSIQLKTVRIPLEGTTGNLTTTLTAVDTIPALATYLPEANKTFRDIFFEIEVQNNRTGVVSPDPQLNLSLDAEAAWGDGAPNDALLGGSYYYRLLKRPDINVSSSHVLSASTTNTGTPFPCLTAVLYATYEYDARETTSVFNSLMIPIFDETGCIGGNTPSLQTRYRRTLPIVDEGPIQLRKSGAKIWFGDGAGVTTNFRVNSQSYASYTWATSVRGGSMVFQRTFDQQLSSSFQRGLNEITFDIYRTGTAVGSLGSNLSGMMYLNYTSSVNPEGGGSNTKTLVTHLKGFTNDVTAEIIIYSSSINQPYMPENYYYLTSGGGLFYVNSLGSVATQWLSWQTQVRPEEPLGSGWISLYEGTFLGDAETGINPCGAFAQEVWRRYPGDPAPDRVSYRKDRNFRFSTGPASTQRIVGNNITTYHSRQFSKSGNIYPNPGDGQIVRIYRNDTNELILTASTDANGQYTVDYHNDTIDLYSEVKVSDTQIGRSNLFRVTGSSTIAPLDIPDVSLELADDYVVVLWSDESPNGYDFGQLDPTRYPTVGSLAGHPAPLFDGTNDFLENYTDSFVDIIGNGAFEIWCVFDIDSVNGNGTSYFSRAALLAETDGWAALSIDANNVTWGYNNDNVTDYVRNDSVSLLGTGVNVVRARMTSERNMLLRVNDRAEIGALQVPALRTWAAQSPRIGGNWNSTRFFDGTCHIWVFQRDLLGWESRYFYKYLQQRYGVTIPTY